MDTTFVYNQVKFPAEINTSVENMPSLPDSIHVSIDNLVNVAQRTVEPVTIWGMTLDWGAIVIPTVSTILVFVVGIIIDIIFKRQASKRKTNEFRETVFSWVSLINDPIIKQISRVKKLVFDISLNQTLQNVRFEFSNSMSNKLDIIYAKNIIHYFIFNSSKPKQDKRAEYAFNVISTLDFLSKVENEVIKQFDVYQRQSLGLMNDWNPAIIDLQNIILNVSHSDKEDKLFNQIASSFYV